MAYAMQGGGVRDDQFFWDGLRDHKLVFQQCSDCGTVRHPIEPMCGNCGSLEWGTMESSGHGTVYTWILSHHPTEPDATPRIVALVELKGWLGGQGANVGELPGPNKGGTVEAAGLKFTLTNAFHSSSSDDGAYLGEACGIVVEAENGTKLYFAGDTCVFGDMQLIGRIYEPDVAILPIGDHFTMGPREAAVALELLGTRRCVPCHYGTFPLLHGTPDELRQLAPNVEVLALQPGESVTV